MEVVNTVFGFADAVSFVINYAYGFIQNVLPDNIGIMYGIAFTVIVGLSIKRGVLA